MTAPPSAPPRPARPPRWWRAGRTANRRGGLLSLVAFLLAGGAAAQTTPPDSATAWFEAVTAGAACDSGGADAFCADLATLCGADAALCRGGFAPFAGSDSTRAVERVVDGERRVVALNTRDEDRFLALPDGAPPLPFVAVSASSGGVAGVPGLVVSVGEADVLYGLRIPARTAVVFRPARPGDVRPKGLDE